MKVQICQQQGDVLLRKIPSIPNKAVRKNPNKGRWILAYGEVTGHAHAIEKIEDCCVYEKGGTMYLSVERAVELEHEEHHTQTLEPGAYHIGIIQEYDYLTEMVRNVVD